MSLCDRFTGLTPLKLRREKAKEVFLLINRYNKYSIKEEKDNNKSNNNEKVIRRKAGDNWF